MYLILPRYRAPIAQRSASHPPFQIQYKSLLCIRSHDTCVKGPDDNENERKRR